MASRGPNGVDEVAVLLGTGSGTFQAATLVPTAAGPTWISVADFSGDGKPDLVVSHSSTQGNSNSVTTLVGNGDGSFQSEVTLTSGYFSYRRADAIAAYSEAIQADASNAAAWRARGLDYLAGARYTDAVADFTQAIKLQAHDEESYKGRGRARAALGEHQDAIADFSYALSIRANDEPVFVDRALSVIALGDLKNALPDLNAAIQFTSEDLRALRARADVNDRLGLDGDAIVDYIGAIRLDPKDPRLYLSRGGVYARNHKYAEALRAGPRHPRLLRRGPASGTR